MQPRREVLREIFSDTRGSGIDIVSFVNFPLDYFRFEYCETIDLRSMYNRREYELRSCLYFSMQNDRKNFAC